VVVAEDIDMVGAGVAAPESFPGSSAPADQDEHMVEPVVFHRLDYSNYLA
jgi:hypothetical protein